MYIIFNIFVYNSRWYVGKYVRVCQNSVGVGYLFECSLSTDLVNDMLLHRFFLFILCDAHAAVRINIVCEKILQLERGGRKVGGGHISQQLFAFILFQYISNFPFPLGASQFPASISFHR